MTTNEFRRALDAFDGARYPLDLRAVKVLRLMLWHPEGCDAVITASSFEIRFGWYPIRHRYVLDTAPPVVSELFRLADAGPGTGVRAQIGPATIATAFSFDRRWLWMDASATTVSIHVRDAAGLSTLHQAGAALPPAPGWLAGVPGMRSVVPS
jgi:hypothetical protein